MKNYPFPNSVRRSMPMFRLYLVGLLCFVLPVVVRADETFVSIQKVSGNRLLVVKGDASGGGGRGRGMQRGSGSMENGQTRGRGQRGGGRRGGSLRSGGSASNVMPNNSLTVTVPSTAKITSAMRERRTFEFRVLGEIPGGLRSPIFQRIKEPLKARIVTKDNRITEVNVISGDTDINQSATSSSGQTVLAVRPKRPPMKKD